MLFLLNSASSAIVHRLSLYVCVRMSACVCRSSCSRTHTSCSPEEPAGAAGNGPDKEPREVGWRNARTLRPRGGRLHEGPRAGIGVLQGGSERRYPTVLMEMRGNARNPIAGGGRGVFLQGMKTVF